MADISMDYTSMATMEALVQTKHDELEEMLDNLDKLVSAAEKNWRGHGHKKFVSSFSKIEADLRVVCECLEQYVTAIKQAQISMEETDTGTVRSIKNKNGNNKEICIDIEPVTNKNLPIVMTINSYSKWKGQGNIRYVSQSNNLKNNGWIASDGSNWTGKAGGECGYASQSMALSYVGIDFSPGDMCDGEYGRSKAKWHTYWDKSAAYGHDVKVRSGVASGKSVKETIIGRVDGYKSDTGMGSVSPVAIHYKSSAGQHSVLVVDYNAKTGVFTAIDPASKSVNDAKRYFTMDDAGNIDAGSGMAWTGNGKAKIDGNVQYLRK